MAKRPKELEPEVVLLNRRLDSMIHAGRSRSDAITNMAREAVRYIYGDQHYGRARRKGWEYPVINRMWSDMIQEVAMLSANNPRIDTPPREDTDIEVAKSVGQVLKGMWSDDLKMRTKIIQGLTDDHITGFKVAKWFWDPKVSWSDSKANQTGNGWEGKINVTVINPRHFGCDPDVELAAEIPTKAKYLHTQRWVDKGWAAQRWPLYGKWLKERGEDISDMNAGGSSGGGKASTDETGFNRSTFAWAGRDGNVRDEREVQARLADFIDGASIEGGDTDYRPKGDNMVLVQEVFFRDYEMETIPSQMEDEPAGEGEATHIIEQDAKFFDTTNPLAEGQTGGQEFEEFRGQWPQRELRPAYEKPKYPNGRLVIRLGDELIVDDRPWPYKSWPFAVAPGYMMPHLWYGINAVEMGRGLQDVLNLIGSHMLNYLKFFSDPITDIEDGVLKRDETKKKGALKNWAGAVNVLVKGGMSRIKRHPAPPMSQSLLQLLDTFKEAQQNVSGVHDVAQGRASSGNTLGELEMLNRNTRQRIALQGAMLDEWLRQIANGVVELMQANFTVGQWVRWTGDEPASVKAAIEWTQEMASAKFDILLEPVSTLPFDEERVAQRYLQAFEITGPAMLEDTLKKLKIENIPEIMAKHEIVGPLTALREMAAEQGLDSSAVVQAVQAQLQALQQIANPEQASQQPADAAESEQGPEQPEGLAQGELG